MGRWLERLRETEKNSDTAQGGTLKTFNTPENEVLRVLKVGGRPVSEEKNDDEFTPEPMAVAKPIASLGLSLEDQIAAFEERAGILEYDEGLSRDKAERLAREQTRHLLH